MPPHIADIRHNPGSNTTTSTGSSNSSTNTSQRRVQSRSVHGTVFYTPRNAIERRPRPGAPTFPTPLIRARQRRPHTIHIVSYPPGYIPSELRGLLQPGHVKKSTLPSQPLRRKKTLPDPTTGQAVVKRRNHTGSRRPHSAHSSLPPAQSSTRARVLEKLIAKFTSQPAQPPSTESLPVPNQASSSSSSLQQSLPTTEAAIPLAQTSSRSSRPNSFLGLSNRLTLTRTRSQDGAQPQPQPSAAAASSASSNIPSVTASSRSQAQPAQSTAPAPIRREPSRSPPGNNPSPPSESAQSTQLRMLSSHPNNSHRNSFMSVRSVKNVKNIMTSSVSELIEKPIAAAGGMSFDIELAEPHLFLYGLDHDPRAENQHNTPAILRGKLRLVVTKNVKIRAITIKFQGKTRTEWPEGLPPQKVDTFEERSLRTMNQTFFNAMHGKWSTPYGNNCIYKLKDTSPDNSVASALNMFGTNNDSHLLTPGMSARDIKRLSLQQVQARSFGKEDSPNVQPTQAKGYKVFYPGTYEFTFDFPIDHHQVESINLPFGSVKWWLEGCIERAGAFKPNLHGNKDVSIIRVPDLLSLETVEPISITRNWEDQLFYDIVISGKSFPVGGKIPIAFKLTPLAKVQLHKLKVIVSESAEYWTESRRVTRRDAGRKIVLFEKEAGKPVAPKYATSSINFTAGGERPYEERREARMSAWRRREREAQLRNEPPVDCPDITENLLGDLDLGEEAYWGSTELEMNVQLPTCKDMRRDPSVRIHPDVCWRGATIHHWIKVVLRISKLDPADPQQKRRRHFEISIDSPFTILNCLATQANTDLPRYSGLDFNHSDCYASAACGCDVVHEEVTPPASNTTSPTSSMNSFTNAHMPAAPRAAHVHTSMRDALTALSSGSGSSSALASSTEIGHAGPSGSSSRAMAHTEQEAAYESPRPIHLMRVPSYAPPAFDADESPPLVAMTPPPEYDMIVGTPSVDGLADYFSRLANYDDGHMGQPSRLSRDSADTDTGSDDASTINIPSDDSDSDEVDGIHMPARISSRGGRVNVPHPHTPGGLHRAPSRSMDIQRPMVPFNLHMANHAVRQTAE